jgi:hypothetical protein
MATNDELERWWAGLTEEQQAEALAAQESGQLSPTVEESLSTAGLIMPGKRKGQALPGDVYEYLKMRH